jgi:hypothetical protein
VACRVATGAVPVPVRLGLDGHPHSPSFPWPLCSLCGGGQGLPWYPGSAMGASMVFVHHGGPHVRVFFFTCKPPRSVCIKIEYCRELQSVTWEPAGGGARWLIQLLVWHAAHRRWHPPPFAPLHRHCAVGLLCCGLGWGVGAEEPTPKALPPCCQRSYTGTSTRAPQ